MATVIPSGETLGATIEGLDLSQPLSGADVRPGGRRARAHGVIRFPASA